MSSEHSGGAQYTKDVLSARVAKIGWGANKVKIETCQTCCMRWVPFLLVMQQVMHFSLQIFVELFPG